MVILSMFVFLEDLQPTIDLFPPRRPRFLVHTFFCAPKVPATLPPEHLAK